MYSSFLETLEGMSTIRASGWQREATNDNVQRHDGSLPPYHLMFCIQKWLTLVLDLLIADLAVMLITLPVTFRGSTTAAQIGIALHVILAVIAAVLRLVESYTELETALIESAGSEISIFDSFGMVGSLAALSLGV
ncbi:hypothetical protein BDV97DRAFT_367715 [Delphinella strobiligena]|nr:hypothetical protein BDV97DRAFT_367715 [Delphinella strobiligena]